MPASYAPKGLAAALAVLLAPWNAHAQTPAQTSNKDIYERIWKFADWYKNDQNPVLQSLHFTGRFQLDYATVRAEQGDSSEWNIRRFRVGAKAKLFRTLTLHGEVDLNLQERDPFYVRLTDLYAEWSKSKEFAVTVGKQAVPFTMDGSTSSKELLTTERNNLSNNLWFPEEYFAGVAASLRLPR